MNHGELEACHHELDKTVAEALVVQAGNSTAIALCQKALQDITKEFNNMRVMNAKTTALYSALGSGAAVAAALIIRWAIMGG